MAKYKAYPEYKDSGVEWLGEIPKKWTPTQVKYGFNVTLGKMLQKTKQSFSDELKPYLKAQNIQPNGINLDVVDKMWFSTNEKQKLKLKINDVLVSEGGDVGRTAIWKGELEECYVQNALNRVRPLLKNTSSFFYYWMIFLKSSEYINIICNKATIAHYTAEKLECTPIFLPDERQQLIISTFLNDETVKIEALIGKQHQLIELLKEKRQAVISHAVTKGLNPDVPMKVSGVEWFGDVPLHWSKTIIKHIAKINPLKTKITPDLMKKECSFIPMENLKLNKIILDEHRVVKDVYNSYTYFEDKDILMAKVTPCFENKNIAIAKNLFNGLGFGTTEIYVIRCNNQVKNEFLFYRLQEDNFSAIAEGSMTGAGGLKRVPQEVVNSFKFHLPSICEQKEIVSFLNSVTAKIDTLIQKQLQQIDLLKERRTALISAAVTGKIDLRDWMPPASSTEASLTTEEATA
ncbi:restriction endonuclease subunit S [Enterobacter hormaechei]